MNVRIFRVLAMECMCAQARPRSILSKPEWAESRNTEGGTRDWNTHGGGQKVRQGWERGGEMGFSDHHQQAVKRFCTWPPACFLHSPVLWFGACRHKKGCPACSLWTAVAVPRAARASVFDSCVRRSSRT